VQPGEALLHAFRHSYGDAPNQLPIDEVIAKLKPWFEDPNALKLRTTHPNTTNMMANYDVQVRGFVHDTMLQSYVLEVHKPHGLAESGTETHRTPGTQL
jgi:DNA polymerase-1